MSLNIIVLLKQVPDTTAVSAKAIKPDGTLNRAVLPAVTNPEDLNALETALQIKERFGASICAITMGPPAATAVLKEALYRGVDRAVILTDRKFAGSDTLSTSYILSRAIRKTGGFDLIICGRQAIDGNTAQVGPQVAEKLGINQLTYVEEINRVDSGHITLYRLIDGGREIVRSPLPVLLTVVDTANRVRPPSVKKMLKYKKAKCAGQIEDPAESDKLSAKGLLIEQWDARALDADLSLCGLSGSPTRVKKITQVVLKGKTFKPVSPDEQGINTMLQELVSEYSFD